MPYKNLGLTSLFHSFSSKNWQLLEKKLVSPHVEGRTVFERGSSRIFVPADMVICGVLRC